MVMLLTCLVCIRNGKNSLSHWDRVTHICVIKVTNIGSNNGLSPGRRQAIIWTNDGILLIWPLGTNFNETLIGLHLFSFNKMRLKMSSGYRRPFCPGLNVLTVKLSLMIIPQQTQLSRHIYIRCISINPQHNCHSEMHTVFNHLRPDLECHEHMYVTQNFTSVTDSDAVISLT